MQVSQLLAAAAVLAIISVALFISGHPAAGGAVGVIGVLTTVIGIFVQHYDAQTQADDEHETPTTAGASRSTSPSPRASQPLATTSSYANNYLSMEDVCRLLGRPVGTYAWLPGQASADSYADRIVKGPNYAYEWSCTKGGAKLTATDLTKGCQVNYPGTVAVTSNPDDGYSWLCRPTAK